MADSDQINIRIKAIVKKPARERLPAKPPPRYPATLLAVFVKTEALRRLAEYSQKSTEYELGGVLVGRTGKSSRRLFVVIDDFIPAGKGVSRRASFEFTNEAQAEIHEVMQVRFQDRQILGWFHTHPGYGIFLSSADQFIDEHYFNEKYHVAMVLDPRKADVAAGVFVWDNKHRRILVPFVEL